ncbi:hypothetical protein [Rheinheimera sp.]|uniref:hypothetical protein n=1 Tax=Rheinheimera sp. TaxID=1869214 RepID=UPI00307DF73A
MRLKLTLVALTCAGMAATTQALPTNPVLQQKPAAHTESLKTEKADFGVYQIQSSLTVAPANLATGKVAEVSGQAIVQAPQASADKTLKANTVVRNLLTGDYGVVTGRLSVLVKDKSALTALEQQFGLKQVKTAGQRIALLQAPVGADLTALLQSVRQSGLVTEARLDVLEKRNKPQ